MAVWCLPAGILQRLPAKLCTPGQLERGHVLDARTGKKANCLDEPTSKQLHSSSLYQGAQLLCLWLNKTAVKLLLVCAVPCDLQMKVVMAPKE
jgi:hypothetical protein